MAPLTAPGAGREGLKRIAKGGDNGETLAMLAHSVSRAAQSVK